jgi:hypothetical protein
MDKFSMQKHIATIESLLDEVALLRNKRRPNTDQLDRMEIGLYRLRVAYADELRLTEAEEVAKKCNWAFGDAVSCRQETKGSDSIKLCDATT